MKRTVKWQQATAAGLIAALSAGTSLAQSGPAASRDERATAGGPVQPARAKGVRRPVIDLERMAKDRRPGQVLPGDAPPFADKPATPGVLPRDLLAPIPRQAPRAVEPVMPAASSAIPVPVASPVPAPAVERIAAIDAEAAGRVAERVAPEASIEPARFASQPGVVVSEIFTGLAPVPAVAATEPVAITELRPSMPVAGSAPVPAVEAPPVRDEPVRDEPRGIVLRSAGRSAEPVIERAAEPMVTPEVVRAVEPAAEPSPELAPAPVREPERTPGAFEVQRPDATVPAAAVAAIEPTPVSVATPAPVAAPVPAPIAVQDGEPSVSAPPAPARVAIAESPRDVPPAREQGVGLLDDRIVSRMPAPASFGPARVSLRSVSGDPSQAQWRTGSTAWRSPEAGESVEGRIEVRAGIDADVKVVVDDAVEITIARLGRVIIERAAEVGGGSLPAITVARGAIEVRLLKEEGVGSEDAHARVRTPDQTFGVRGAVRVEYDAFGGTRRTGLPG